MITLSKGARMILVVAAAADIMVFSRITTLPLIAIVVGTAMALLGIEYSYRPASFAGLLVMAMTGAASIEITSFLELDAVLTAMIGLLIPVLVLAWLALSAEEGERQQVSVMKKPAAISLGYVFTCLWSVPIVIFIMSLLIPTTSMRITMIAEVAIITIVTIAGGLFLARRRPAISRPSAIEKASTK